MKIVNEVLQCWDIAVILYENRESDCEIYLVTDYLLEYEVPEWMNEFHVSLLIECLRTLLGKEDEYFEEKVLLVCQDGTSKITDAELSELNLISVFIVYNGLSADKTFDDSLAVINKMNVSVLEKDMIFAYFVKNLGLLKGEKYE